MKTGIDLDSRSSFITNDNKVEKNVGGRSKGLTKRIINRYKKVYNQFTILKKKVIYLNCVLLIGPNTSSQ